MHLMSVEVVCRQHEAIHALPHVVQSIEECLVDLFHLSLVQIVAHGSCHLVRLVLLDGIFDRCFPGDQLLDAMVFLLRQVHGNSNYCTRGDATTRRRHFTEMLQLLHDHTQKRFLSVSLMDLAASEGNVEMLQWLQQNRHEGCSTVAMDEAASNGHLQALRFLRQHQHELCSPKALQEAARNGHLEVVRFLIAEKLFLNENPVREVFGELHRVQFHAESWEGCTTRAFVAAASRGHDEILKLFIDQELEINDFGKAIEKAVVYGHLQTVKFLCEYEPTDRCIFKCWFCLMQLAIEHAQLEVFELLYHYSFGDDSISRTQTSGARGGDGGGKAKIHVMPEELLCQKFHTRIRYLLQVDAFLNDYDKGKFFQCIAKTKGQRGLEWIALRFPHVTFGDEVMAEAAKANDVELMQWLLANNKSECCCQAMYYACQQGNLQAVKLLVKTDAKRSWNSHAVDVVAKNGFLDLVEYFYESVNELPRDLDPIAGEGHLDVLEWFHSRGLLQRRLSKKAMDSAATYGRMHIVKYLHKNFTHGCSENAINGAASNGHLEIVQFLLQTRHERFTADGILEAIRHDHLDIALLLLRDDQTRDSWRESAFCLAAELGHFRLLRHFFEDDSTVLTRQGVSRIAHRAITSGSVSTLQWLYQLQLKSCGGGRIDFSVFSHSIKQRPMDLAAQHGFFPIVRFLHERNPSENEALCSKNAIDAAASAGYLHVVKFLYQMRGEGYTRKAINEAASNGHMKIVKYLHSHPQNGRGWTPRGLECAALSGNLEMVEFLMRNFPPRAGARWSPSKLVIEAANSDYVEIVKFFITKYHPNEALVKEAIEATENQPKPNPNPVLLQWLQQQVAKRTRKQSRADASSAKRCRGERR